MVVVVVVVVSSCGNYWVFLFVCLFTTASSHRDFSKGKFGLISPGKASYDRVALLFTTALSHRDFSQRKFGLISLGKASYDRDVLPNLRCMLGVLVCP